MEEEKKEEVKEEPKVEVPKVTEEDVNSFIAAMKKAQEMNKPQEAKVEEPPKEVSVPTPVASTPVAPAVASQPVEEAKVEATVAPSAPTPAQPEASSEFSYDNNLYGYDYSATSNSAPAATNPLDIEKTQYLDPIAPTTGAASNV